MPYRLTQNGLRILKQAIVDYHKKHFNDPRPTNQSIADRAQIHRTTVAKILAGREGCQLMKIEKLFDAQGLKVDYQDVELAPSETEKSQDGAPTLDGANLPAIVVEAADFSHKAEPESQANDEPIGRNFDNEIDQPALRKAIVANFSLEELATLVQEIEADLHRRGYPEPLNLDIVGGNGLPARTLNLIVHLRNRGFLTLLQKHVRLNRPGVI